MSLTENGSYGFGGFTLDAGGRELLYLNNRIELNDRDLDVLLFLVRNAPRVISVAELSSNVWGADAQLDETNARHHIAKIRKALDCDPRSPTFIETISKRGYRFIGDVKHLENVPASASRDGPDGEEHYLITSHMFVPVLLGPAAFSELGDMKQSRWVRYEEIPTDEGRLCILSSGVAVWHLRKTMRFRSMSTLARWRLQIYRQVLEGRHKLNEETGKLLRGSLDETVFKSKIGEPGYVLSAFVMEMPRWSNAHRIRNALQMLASPTALESSVKLRRDDELVMERRILEDGVENGQMQEFGLPGIDVGFACWDGVSYFVRDEQSAGIINDLVEFEIAVQSIWWFASCLSDEIRQSGSSAKKNFGKAVGQMKEMFARLESIGPLDTPSQRTMMEAILSTSRVERLVNETIRQFENM